MAMLIPVTQMNDVKVLVGLYGIKMIEESAYIFERDADKKLRPVKDGVPVPETTQPMEKASPAAVHPVTCTKITFHDDKALIVKESMGDIANQVAANP